MPSLLNGNLIQALRSTPPRSCLRYRLSLLRRLISPSPATKSDVVQRNPSRNYSHYSPPCSSGYHQVVKTVTRSRNCRIRHRLCRRGCLSMTMSTICSSFRQKGRSCEDFHPLTLLLLRLTTPFVDHSPPLASEVADVSSGNFTRNIGK